MVAADATLGIYEFKHAVFVGWLNDLLLLIDDISQVLRQHLPFLADILIRVLAYDLGIAVVLCCVYYIICW